AGAFLETPALHQAERLKPVGHLALDGMDVDVLLRSVAPRAGSDLGSRLTYPLNSSRCADSAPHRFNMPAPGTVARFAPYSLKSRLRAARGIRRRNCMAREALLSALWIVYRPHMRFRLRFLSGRD